MEEEHDFKPLKIERDGKKVQACQECGALKIGEDTIVVDKDYIDLAPLTSDPALAEGRVWFRGDTDETRWSPDGINVEIWGTASAPGATYDLTSIKGFTYLATGTPTDSWYFTADPNKDVWIRQHPTAGVFDAKYNFYGSYAHWTADNTFVDVPNKAANVYGDGELMSVSQIPTGVKTGGWDWDGKLADPHGLGWDGQYFWAVDNDSHWVYQLWEDFTKTNNKFHGDWVYTGIEHDGVYLWVGCGGRNGIYQYRPDGTPITRIASTLRVEGVAWDGQYLFATIGALTGPGWIYKINPETDTIVDSNGPGLGGGDINELCFDGTYLWSADDDSDYIYCFDPDTLTEVDKGWSEPGWPWGLAWDGRYMHTSHRGYPGGQVAGPNHVYQYTGPTSFDLNYNISPA